MLGFSQRELSDSNRQDETAGRILRLVETLTEYMKPWKEIASFQPGEAKSSQIPEFREEFVNLSNSGLAVIGRVAHEISKTDEREWGDFFIALASKFDWRRDGKIWRDSKLVEIDKEKGRKRITGGRDVIENTVNRIVAELGINNSKISSRTGD